MKNNKGFTIIELAVSFVLVATISLTLLQLVLSLKEIYLSGEVKTTLLNKQGIMTKNIYDDINNKGVISISSCGLSCLRFTYNDFSSKDLIVDPGNKTVTYGDYTMKLTNDSYFGELVFKNEESSSLLTTDDDSVFKIDIPIKSKLMNDEDFGFHIVKTYNHNYLDVNTSTDIENTKLTLSGIPCNIKVLTDSNDPTKVLSVFVNIYHQDKDEIVSDQGGELFLKNYDSTKNSFSSLISLEAFRTKIDSAAIINKGTEELNQNSNGENVDKNIQMLTEGYNNGYLSLLLNYNNNSFSDNKYAWWYQTSNFAKKELLKNSVFNIHEEGVTTNGLTYNNEDNYWANILGSQTNLGVKTGGQIIDLENQTANSVDLYVEAREYICNHDLINVTYHGSSIRNLILADGSKFCPEVEANVNTGE